MREQYFPEKVKTPFTYMITVLICLLNVVQYMQAFLIFSLDLRRFVFVLIHLSVLTAVRLVGSCKRAQSHSARKPLGFGRSSERLQMLLSGSVPLFVRTVRERTRGRELAYPTLSSPN